MIIDSMRHYYEDLVWLIKKDVLMILLFLVLYDHIVISFNDLHILLVMDIYYLGTYPNGISKASLYPGSAFTTEAIRLILGAALVKNGSS